MFPFSLFGLFGFGRRLGGFLFSLAPIALLPFKIIIWFSGHAYRLRLAARSRRACAGGQSGFLDLTQPETKATFRPASRAGPWLRRGKIAAPPARI